MKPYLSKSQFLRGLQCYKSLCLYKNKPELRTLPDEVQQAIFDTGTEVGILAKKLFPDGQEIVYEEGSFNEKVMRTNEFISNDVATIYEATFIHNNVLVMVDILHKGNNGWEIYEVKSSTGVGSVHIRDLSVQFYVLSGCELPISRASLVYINNQYVKDGELNIKELFCIKELTHKIEENQEFVNGQLNQMQKMLKRKCPDIDIGVYCDEPYKCDFKAYCWSHVPEYSVFNISGLRTNKKFELYYNGILEFEDIPDDYSLNSHQRLQVESELMDMVVIAKKGIKEFLDSLYYPLYFLDFETFMPAIPVFDGMHPYQKIPFQYSLHILESENAELKHHEFLGKEGVDPREKLIENLVSLIPDDACVLAYNMGFEKGVINDLAKAFPKYSKKLLKMNDNMFDLMVPFRNKHYYTKEMKGSFSIKSVLPALIPELTYEGMEISSGGEAMDTYATLHLLKDEKEVKKIRKNLLEYCKLDTFGMVRLLEKLKGI